MKEVLGQKSFHHGGVGGDDEIVLVHAPCVVAFAFERADYAEGYRLEAYYFAHRVGSLAKQFLDDGLPDDAYFCAFLDILVGEYVAFVDFPLAYVEIVGGLAVYGGVGVVGSINHLPGSGDTKLLHGHAEALVEAGVDAIWYPCMSYNNDEGIGDNHYNCPVVAYYPELLAANMPVLKQTKYLDPYVGLWRRKDFEKRIAQMMLEQFDIPKKETAAAVKAAYAAYDAYVEDVRATGRAYIEYAREHHMPILVACGRPYHIDPEINHGINDLITSFGFVLVTEDALSYLEGYAPRKVLNQWTFQSRMYNAARYVCTQPDMQVVQLVSFGCGTDAITTDELRSILEEGGKLYTQLKIDDISNLGAVKIRIRSLMAAMEARNDR